MTPDFDSGTGTQCFDKCERKIIGHGESEKGHFAANDVGPTLLGRKTKPLRFSGKLLKTPVKIVPVNDLNLSVLNSERFEPR